MQDRTKIGRAPNYTVPFFIAAGVLLFFTLLVIAGLWGWGAVVLTAWLVDCAINRRWPWRAF